MPTKFELINQIDSIKSKIDTYNPFSGNLSIQLKNFYKVGTTYSSNALEKISYTETETKVLIEDGLTAGGKPIMEALAVLGHAKAFDYMFDLLCEKSLKIEHILALHGFLEGGLSQGKSGEFRKTDIFITGSDFIFPKPMEVINKMKEFENWVNDNYEKLHPLELASLVHLKLVTIHPFSDGNGRISRLCMNTILIQNGYLPVIIPPVLRNEYIESIRITQTQKRENQYLIFMLQCVKESQKEIYRMIRGSSDDLNDEMEGLKN